MMRLGMFLLLALTLAVTTGLGCYTMVRHPAVGAAPEETAEPGCDGCHASADYHLWADPYYTTYYRYYPPAWGAYYALPWWYDGYWWGAPGSGTPALPLETDGRHAWDRGPGAPYVPPSGGPAVTDPTPPKITGPRPADATEDENNGQAREQKPKNEKKRNAWGR